MRLSILLLVVLLAACGRKPVPVATPAARATAGRAETGRPAWTARKVAVGGTEVAAASLVVAVGEGWPQVALRAGVPAGALRAVNKLAAGAQPIAGQRLEIPGGRVHTVAAGETGIAIARAYGVDWAQVVAANRLTPPYVLEIGDRLLLPTRREVAALSIEARARAFQIDIDDLITGAEPAVTAPPVRGTAPSVRGTAPPGSGTPPPPRTAPAVVAAAPLPPLPTGAPRFVWPVEGRILSGFGPKPGGRYNDGVNLKAGAGSAVRAAADGVVAYAGDAVAGFGKLILIKHADGWVSAYGHNEALLVARGARVGRGEVIARAGSTGSVDEPQLHFELRRGRAPVDPVRVLPARG